MIERNLIDSNITKGIQTKYFEHYKNGMQNLNIQSSWSFHSFYNDPIENNFFKNYNKLSKNNWELHKQLINEGVNPNEIAKIIRKDEIEKLQEKTSQNDFDFNQKIEPSLYERCSFVNQRDVSLIDYAAFFGSIKCFKYLLMNGANVENTGKYAVAGGNVEIVHLCEQNHSSFEDAYKTAIEFHQIDLFKYIYENKLEEMSKNLTDLGCLCVDYGNYEILLFLEEEGMEINRDIFQVSAKIGNLYLVMHFLQKVEIPNDILFACFESKNIELVNFVMEQKGIDINAKDIYLFYLKFILIIFYFKIIFGNYLYYFIQHLLKHLKMDTLKL